MPTDFTQDAGPGSSAVPGSTIPGTGSPTNVTGNAPTQAQGAPQAPATIAQTGTDQTINADKQEVKKKLKLPF